MTGTRDGAIARAEKYFDDGGFLEELQRRVAIPTTSQEAGSMPALQEYVSGEMTESLSRLGYDCTVQANPRAEYGPFLIARRIEDPHAIIRPRVGRRQQEGGFGKPQPAGQRLHGGGIQLLAAAHYRQRIARKAARADEYIQKIKLHGGQG